MLEESEAGTFGPGDSFGGVAQPRKEAEYDFDLDQAQFEARDGLITHQELEWHEAEYCDRRMIEKQSVVEREREQMMRNRMEEGKAFEEYKRRKYLVDAWRTQIEDRIEYEYELKMREMRKQREETHEHADKIDEDLGRVMISEDEDFVESKRAKIEDDALRTDEDVMSRVEEEEKLQDLKRQRDGTYEHADRLEEEVRCLNEYMAEMDQELAEISAAVAAAAQEKEDREVARWHFFYADRDAELRAADLERRFDEEIREHIDLMRRRGLTQGCGCAICISADSLGPY